MVLQEPELALFKRHYSKMMYQAILTCTQRSLTSMKKRLGSKTSTGFLFMERPFFDVDVELKVCRARVCVCVCVCDCGCGCVSSPGCVCMVVGGVFEGPELGMKGAALPCCHYSPPL